MIPSSQNESDLTKLGFAAYVAKTGKTVRIPFSDLENHPHYSSRTDWWSVLVSLFMLLYLHNTCAKPRRLKEDVSTQDVQQL